MEGEREIKKVRFSFEDLEVWQKAVDFAKWLLRFLKKSILNVSIFDS